MSLCKLLSTEWPQCVPGGLLDSRKLTLVLEAAFWRQLSGEHLQEHLEERLAERETEHKSEKLFFDFMQFACG